MTTIEQFEIVRMSPPADPDYVIICRTDDLLYEALSVVCTDAHSFHRFNLLHDVDMCLRAVEQLSHCDPVNTGMLISELEEIGFRVSAPVVVGFVTDLPDDEQPTSEAMT